MYKRMCLLVCFALTACSAAHNGNTVRYKDNMEVSENEFNHDLKICNNQYKDYINAPLVLEPRSKEEFFRYCLGTLGYHDKPITSDSKKTFTFNFKEIQLNLIKVGN